MAEFSWDVLLGDGQVGFPRVSFSESVVFQVRDFNGRPLPRTRVYPHLLDAGSSSAEIRPDWADLATAARTGKASTDPEIQDLVDTGVLVREEASGRLASGAFTTDEQGRVSLRVWAPLRYGRTIALLISLKPQPEPDKREGLAFLRSRDSAEGSQFLLVSTAGDTLAAATPFDLTIRLTDKAGNVDATLEGDLAFTIRHNASRSWTGLAPQMPAAFTCTFIAGTCPVPGGPFLLPAAQSVQVELIPEIESYTSGVKTFQVNAGSPASVAIATPEADGSPTAVTKLELVIGDSVDLQAHYVDLGGNITGTPEDALWVASNPNLQLDFPETGAAAFRYTPTSAGSGEIVVEGSLARTTRPLIINIPHGALARWDIEPVTAPPFAAGQCTKLNVTARDAYENTVTSLNETVNLTLSLTGHKEGTPAFFDTQLRLGSATGDQFTLPIAVTAGQAVLPAELCLHKAVESGATLTATGRGVETPYPFQVRAGPPSVLMLSRQAGNSDAPSLCTNHQDTRSIESPCIVFSADEGAFNASLLVTDSSGNVLSPAENTARVTATGPLSAAGAVGDVTARASSAPTVRIAAGRSGDGLLTLTQGTTLSTRYTYRVNPGARTELKIDVTQDGRAAPLTTDKELDVTLTWLDEHGNTVTTYSGTEDVQLELTPADPSPDGTLPTAQFTDSVTFTEGTVVLPAALAAVAAPASPVVSAATAQGTFTSASLNITPGAISKLEARDASGADGTLLTDPIEMDVFDSLVVFAAGLDRFGNYVRDVDTTFEGSKTYITQHLSRSRGFSTLFQPREPGTGFVTLKAAGPGGTVLSAQTGLITVTARSASAFIINTTNNLTETAGVPFAFIIDAVDSEGYKDVTFNQTINLQTSVQSQRSWREIAPTLPSGVVSCTFTEGRCELLPTVGTGWVITDALQPTALTVQDLSGNIPRAWSALITVLKGEPSEVLLADLPGGPDGGATIYESAQTVRLTTDDTVSFASSAVDQGGNWLYDVPSTWSSNLTKIGSAISPLSGPTTTYNPVQKVLVGEAGQITATYLSPNNETLSKSLNVVTGHGVPVRIRISVDGQPGPTLESGVCAPLRFEVVDAEDNVADTYNLSNTIRFGAKGLAATGLQAPFDSLDAYAIPPGIYRMDSSPIHVSGLLALDPTLVDPVFSTAPYRDFSKAQGATFPDSVFSSGRLVTNFSFCSGQVAAGLTAQIDASLPPVTLSDLNLSFGALTGSSVAFQPVHSAPHLVAFVLLNKNDSVVHYCAHKPNTIPQIFSGAVLSLNTAAVNSPTGANCRNTEPSYSRKGLLVDDHYTVKPVLLDRGGLYLRDAVGQWETVSVPFTETVTYPSGSLLRFTGRLGTPAPGGDVIFMTPRYTFRFRDFNTGTATQDDPANDVLSGSYGLALASGAATEMNLKSSIAVKADQEFRLEFTLRDRYDNLTLLDTSLVKTLTFTQSSGTAALNAPNASVAARPPQGAITFSRDSDELPTFISDTTFQLPRAGQTMSYQAQTTVSGNSLSGTLSLTSDPGPAADYILTLKESGAQPADPDNDLIFTHRLIDDSAYFLHAIDALGNLFRSEEFDLSATGALDGWLTATAATNAFQMQPPLSGSGTLNINPRNTDLSPRTYTVQVLDSEPVRVEVVLESAGTVVTAPQLGVPYDVRLTFRDADDNQIASINGPQTVEVQMSGVFETAEEFLDNLTQPADNIVTFTQGLSDPGQITLTAYASSTGSGKRLSIVRQPGGAPQMFLSDLPAIPAGPFHHFGMSLTSPTAGAKTFTYAAALVPSASFGVRLQWRDIYGNPTTEGSTAPVTLTVVRDEDGSAAVSPLLGPVTSGITVTQATGTTVSNLSFAPPGMFRLRATAAGVTPSPLLASPLLIGTPSGSAVATYALRASGQAAFGKKAGEKFALEVIARDAEGQTLSTIDAALNALTFSQSGVLQAPNGEQPGFSVGSFAGGRAYFDITPKAAQYLASGSLTITDNLGRSGSLPEALTVEANYDAEYHLTPTATTRTADATASGLFGVTIRPKDNYGNFTGGKTGLRLAVRWLTGNMAGETLGVYDNPAAASSAFINASDANGVTLTGFFVGAPGTGELVLIDTLGTELPSVAPPLMTFTATEATLAEYGLVPLATSVIAGSGNLTLTVSARDGSYDILPGLDSVLDARQFFVRGAGVSPDGQPPTILSRTPFVNGVSTFVISLFKAETILAEGLVVYDNGPTRLLTNPGASFTGTGVGGAVIPPLTVLAGPPVDLRAATAPSPVAGSPFGLTITSTDAYGNTTSDGCTDLTLSGGLSSPGGHGGAVVPATVPGSVTFNGTAFEAPGVILARSGAETLTASACGLSNRPINLTVAPGPFNRLVLQNANDITGVERTSVSLFDGESEDLWLVTYDALGNLIKRINTTYTTTGVNTTLSTFGGEPSRTRVNAQSLGTDTLTVTPNEGGHAPFTVPVSVSDRGVKQIVIVPEGPNGTGSEVNAGDEILFRLHMKDDLNNLVAGFSGSKQISFGTNTFAANPEGKSVSLPATGQYTFTGGISDSTFSFRAYNAATGGQIIATHTLANATTVTGARSYTVNPGPFHHYGVTATANYTPRADRGSAFSATVSLRDLHGNDLSSGGPGLPVTLSIIRENGTAALGALGGTTTTAAVTPTTTVNDLTYDDAGAYKILASDGSTGTPLAAASTVTMQATFALLTQYRITLPGGGNTTAGAAYVPTVTAAGVYNQAIVGMDAALNVLSFAFTGFANAPSGTPPVLPTTLTFTNGVAPASMTLYNAQTHAGGSISVTDSRSPPLAGATAGSLLVNPGPLSGYELSATHTSRTADSQASGVFGVTITAFDAWGNIRAGETGLTVAAERLSGAALTGPVRVLGGGTATGLTVGSSPLNLPSLFYNVAQEVRLKVGNTTVPTLNPPQINFSLTKHTIASYGFAAPLNASVGLANVSVTLTAVDGGGNTITGLDTELNTPGEISFAWSGAPTVGAYSPSYGTLSGQFSAGVATVSHSLYSTQSIPAGSLVVTDSLGRTGSNPLPISFNPGAAASITVNPIAAQTAGSAFQATVAITDSFGNPTGSGCGPLTVTGGNTSPANGFGTSTAPVLTGAASQSIVGSYTTGTLRLYGSTFSTGANTLSFSACGLSANATVTVNPEVTEYVVTRNVNTPPSAPADQLAELSCPLTTGNTSQCSTLYAFLYDLYGNRSDPENNTCTWSFVDNGAVAAGAASTPAVSGGVSQFTLNHSTFFDGSLICTRNGKSASVLAFGGISRVALTHTSVASPLLAGNNNLTISQVALKQRRSNSEIAFSQALSSETMTFTTTSTVAFGTSAGTLGVNATKTCNFNTSGLCTSSTAFDFSKAETARELRVAVRGLSSAAIGPFDVLPANAASLTVTYSPTGNVAAGAAFTAAVEAKDAFGNLTDRTNTGGACGTVSVTAGAGATASAGSPGVATSPVLPTAGENTRPGTGTHTTGTIRLYAAGSNTLNFSVCGLSASVAKTVTAGTLEYLQIKTTDTAGATPVSSTQRGQPAVIGAAIECPHTATTGGSVTCPAFYAWAYDGYGNTVSAPSQCTWSYANTGTSTGAVSPTPPGSAAHNWSPTASSFIDGRITCSADGVDAHADVWGGTHSLVASASPSFPLTAGADNLSVSLTLRQSKNNVVVNRSSATASTVTMSTTSAQPFGTSAGALGQNQTLSTLSFTSGVASGLLFDFTLAQSGTSLSLSAHGQTATISSIEVVPAAAATVVANTTTATAGVPVNVTATVRDSFGNTVTTAAGCGSLTLSGANPSPGGYGGSGATSASYPGPVAAASPGVYGPFSMTLYNASAANSVQFSVAGCNGSGVSTPISYTVAPAAVNSIYVSTANSVPASGSQLNSLACSEGTTVSCGPLYAFGFDTYGNNIQGTSFQCGSWSFSPSTGFTGWVGEASNAHSTTLTHSSSHIDGILTCTSGTASHGVSLSGSITRAPQLNCGNWFCSSGSPAATCTATNTTGYAASYLSISNITNGTTTYDESSCLTTLNPTDSCSISVGQSAGSSSGTLTLSGQPTPANAAFVDFAAATAQVQSGAPAPNCQDQLAVSSSGWSCSAGQGLWSGSVINTNDLETATLASSSPIDINTPVNGAIVEGTTTCSTGLTLAPGASCAVKITQPNPGFTTTFTVQEDGSYFGPSNFTTTASPNCSQDVTLAAAVQTACSGTGGSKTLRFTLTNPNSLNNFPISSITAAQGTVSSSCWPLLAKGASCTFDLVLASTPTSATDASITITTSASPLIFNTSQVFNSGANYDISCP